MKYCMKGHRTPSDWLKPVMRIGHRIPTHVELIFKYPLCGKSLCKHISMEIYKISNF